MRHIVELLEPDRYDEALSLFALHNCTVIDYLPQIHTFLVEATEDDYDFVFKCSWLEDPVEDKVVSPQFTPNDTDFNLQWNLNAIRVPEVWDTTFGDSTTIAILDSGFTPAFSDFSGRFLTGRCVVTDSTDTSAVYPHGTYTASVAAATFNNHSKIAGVAPHSKIYPIRITTDTGGNATDFYILKGLLWASMLVSTN
jgi:subtilisin family serine protease